MTLSDYLSSSKFVNALFLKVAWVACVVGGNSYGLAVVFAMLCLNIYQRNIAADWPYAVVLGLFGLVLDSGSSYFLPRLVGTQRAFEMATMGNKIKAQQAFEWGMVNRLVPHEQLDQTVEEVAEYYSKAPTKAIGMMKKMLNKSSTSTLEDMLQCEAYCQEIAGRSSDYKEGVSAFNDKRKPQFKGS